MLNWNGRYLSYDEIMLASLLGVSGPSFFINDGSRYNSGKPAKPGTFESRGVIIGLVGARFERADRMDSSKSSSKVPGSLGSGLNRPCVIC